MSTITELPGFEMPASAAPNAFEETLAASFPERVQEFILTHLRRHGPTSGEDLTDAMVAAEITPPKGDGRRYGPVYQSMSARGLIEVYGVGHRRKGNGTLGAAIWRVTAKGLAA
jgi:hypothetical protein